MPVRPIVLPIVRPVTGRPTQAGKKPKPGDYLLDSKHGNYLTDESGNRLTA